jgi:hypothetical protein
VRFDNNAPAGRSFSGTVHGRLQYRAGSGMLRDHANWRVSDNGGPSLSNSQSVFLALRWFDLKAIFHSINHGSCRVYFFNPVGRSLHRQSRQPDIDQRFG